ncbi:hypothetical protein ElyMa_001480200 [Elysia marginata]|uniref:Uncharacterized protein n=1 Tax=Elysia marginata TaxID=1093978 RepID=A0AAV4J1V0_9GAST|nr:hypothetical protein ElyMa_001480200 [Elysia marginata]
MEALADSDADEAEFHQKYYDNSSSDDDFDSDRASDDEDGGRSKGSLWASTFPASLRLPLNGYSGDSILGLA